MSQRADFIHVADLVRLCAETMRAISRTKLDDVRACPFKHVVTDLEHLSDEIKQVASELPSDWGGHENGHA